MANGVADKAADPVWIKKAKSACNIPKAPALDRGNRRINRIQEAAAKASVREKTNETLRERNERTKAAERSGKRNLRRIYLDTAKMDFPVPLRRWGLRAHLSLTLGRLALLRIDTSRRPPQSVGIAGFTRR